MEEIETNNIKIDLVNEKESKYFYKIFKRLFDVVSSLIALIILSPIFIIIAIIIKIDSQGEVIFGHNRLGMNGKIIKVYKFRTMVKNAQEILKKLPEEQKREFEKNFKLENDPRITKVGKFLRKTSLDELPQLFNILIGNMSVVGPRPIVENEIEKYGKYGKKLLTVKPGLTGNWQANGRSNTTYEERVQLDMEYIDNRSFWFDIKIIFKTIVSVFKREGAI